jgi:hypothetical protein
LLGSIKLKHLISFICAVIKALSANLESKLFSKTSFPPSCLSPSSLSLYSFSALVSFRDFIKRCIGVSSGTNGGYSSSSFALLSLKFLSSSTFIILMNCFRSKLFDCLLWLNGTNFWS